MINPGLIQIKNQDVLLDLLSKPYDSNLSIIISEIAEKHGLIIDESYRDQLNPNDLHGLDPVRAVDLSSTCYEIGQNYRIMDEINERWIYDPERPAMRVAMIHDAGQGIHFHIQVHPRTRERSYNERQN
jgi:hypothetical protein